MSGKKKKKELVSGCVIGRGKTATFSDRNTFAFHSKGGKSFCCHVTHR